MQGPRPFRQRKPSAPKATGGKKQLTQSSKLPQTPATITAARAKLEAALDGLDVAMQRTLLREALERREKRNK